MLVNHGYFSGRVAVKTMAKPYRREAARLRLQADVLREVARSLANQGIDARFVERQAWACGVEANLLLQGVPLKSVGFGEPKA